MYVCVDCWFFMWTSFINILSLYDSFLQTFYYDFFSSFLCSSLQISTGLFHIPFTLLRHWIFYLALLLSSSAHTHVCTHILSAYINRFNFFPSVWTICIHHQSKRQRERKKPNIVDEEDKILFANSTYTHTPLTHFTATKSAPIFPSFFFTSSSQLCYFIWICIFFPPFVSSSFTNHF